MVIPKDALIPESKIRDYLLIPLRKSDKSKYLSLAGYNREDYWELIRDIRQQLLPAEGSFEERKPDGELYRAIGELTGPNGRTLRIKTVWLRKWTGEWRFITLLPDRKPQR